MTLSTHYRKADSLKAYDRDLVERLTVGAGAAYVFSVPWENVLIVPGIGTLTRIIGGAFIVIWFLLILTRGEVRSPHPFHLLLYAILAWISASLYWTVEIDSSSTALLTVALLSITSMSIWDTFDSRSRLLGLVQAYVLGCGIVIALLITNYLLGNVSAGDNRAAIANSNENTLGQTLAIGMGLAWYLATRAPKASATSKMIRAYNYAYPLLALVGILLTASRTAFIMTGPFFAYLIMSVPRLSSPQRGALLMGLVASLSAVMSFVPASSFERISTIDEQVSNLDFGSRFSLWQDGWALLVDEPLHLVIGSGAETLEAITGRDSHNTPLAVAVETGLIGILISLLIVWVVVSAVLGMAPGDKLLWVSVLTAWGLGLLTTNSLTSKVTWLVLALAIGYANPLAMRLKTGTPPKNDN